MEHFETKQDKIKENFVPSKTTQINRQETYCSLGQLRITYRNHFSILHEPCAEPGNCGADALLNKD